MVDDDALVYSASSTHYTSSIARLLLLPLNHSPHWACIPAQRGQHATILRSTLPTVLKSEPAVLLITTRVDADATTPTMAPSSKRHPDLLVSRLQDTGLHFQSHMANPSAATSTRTPRASRSGTRRATRSSTATRSARSTRRVSGDYWRAAHPDDQGATGIVEMLFCTSLVALVGAPDTQPSNSPRKLQIVNTKVRAQSRLS